jgi:hypothetical protein
MFQKVGGKIFTFFESFFQGGEIVVDHHVIREETMWIYQEEGVWRQAPTHP